MRDLSQTYESARKQKFEWLEKCPICGGKVEESEFEGAEFVVCKKFRRKHFEFDWNWSSPGQRNIGTNYLTSDVCGISQEAQNEDVERIFNLQAFR